MKSEQRRRRACRLCAVIVAVAAATLGGNNVLLDGQTRPVAGAVSGVRTTAGEFFVEPPTLIALGFEWRIGGDANHNARVEVAYRKVGDVAWQTGLPLLRIQREPTEPPARGGGAGEGGGGSPFRFVPPNRRKGAL